MATPADAVPLVGEPVVVVDVLGSSVTKGCSIGANVNAVSLDIKCPLRTNGPEDLPQLSGAYGWVFSAASRLLLGYTRYRESGTSLVKAVKESALLTALAHSEPIYRAPRFVRGFVPVNTASNEDLSAFVARSTMFFTGTLWGRMDDADCIAVRISETKVLVPGCKDVDPDWLAYSRAKSLQRHRFDLVIGDSIPTGKRLRVDLTRRTNDTNALIFNARLGDEVEIAYLATSAPKIDEPVVIVRGAGWEKSVRTDCTIGPSLKKEDAFGLMCMDGAFSLDQGDLVFSAVDETLLGFGKEYRSGAVATVSIMDAVTKGLAAR